ncbi:pyrimidine-nucleoside phosphorylase [Thermotomaculum hydrothermale]|uniref:thymidine phosphorylase n=1 Tax=Thermotomaculum hydrothermale TaxID=981385 RepID=A0A7R6SYD3_9BACT|nr:thymidine phosphorylase [Thermotomaculum hydrothermale]BBB31755.1 pyrimidine-nucleoside phosphorylase [Thermotomaculum hydrothermale]
MDIVSIIKKKRDKQALTKEEIYFFIEGVTNGTIPDYQISALLMAIVLNGMNEEETFYLTEAMMKSGDILDLSEVEGFKCDKHSTGGVGDKITMIIAPLAASLGIKVPMFSGPGLGHTGGTTDKLDSIPGFKTLLTEDEFIESLKKVGIANSIQSKNITPADKKLYALRDVTGTVESIPLITASIMSKKLACGADGLVLDVKFGKGAFMKTKESAEILAKSLLKMAPVRGIKAVALIDDMNEPLGYNIGNALEIIETFEVLKGKKVHDLLEVSVEIVKQMLILSGDGENAEERIYKAIEDGSALKKYTEWIEFSGGNPEVINDYSLFPSCENKLEIKSEQRGYVKEINSYNLGMAGVYLKAGRLKKEDKIDYGAGIVLNKKVGDFVEKGETLLTMYFNDTRIPLNEIEALVKQSFEFSKEEVSKTKRIHNVIR